MSEKKRKRRLRSVILISAVSAVACGGRAQESDRDGPQESSGDGDSQVVGDYVGSMVGGDGDGDEFVGLPTVGEPIGDQPIGDPPDYIGTGGSFAPGTGGGGPIGVPPELGGMGGTPGTTGEPR